MELNLESFRQAVDQTSAKIAACEGDLLRLYDYVGLDHRGSYQVDAVGNALYERIRQSFSSGHGMLWRACRSLETDLIREHVLHGAPLDPYFEVLNRIRDAVRSGANDTGDIAGDWSSAIRAAQDHIEINTWRTTGHERIFSREFAVARAAKFLMTQGYRIRLDPGVLVLEETAEVALVAEIERLVSQLGGLNVARKIFSAIAPTYDNLLQRYQIVPNVSMTGGGDPQIPWGYLLQLAVKHVDGRKPYLDLEANWPRLEGLTAAYAATIDVQPYTPSAWLQFDAAGVLKYIQEQALYDSTFRFAQLRASDVPKLCRGSFSFLDNALSVGGTWSLDDAFQVIEHLAGPAYDRRGPVIISEPEVRRALPHIHKDRIHALLSEVLSHTEQTPNQGYSRPTDSPTPSDRLKGADFYLKPLIRRQDRQYLIIDRSTCGWGYIEALLTALRPHVAQLDEKVGHSIEDFLDRELASHGVPTVKGKYEVQGEEGECDLVAVTPRTLVFMELKKKSLTRRARAGSDADLLLDLAGSLLSAQAQAGWHEIRIKSAGSLNLASGATRHHLPLNDRDVERVAVGMHDFGGFQDRIMLKHFLEATLNVNFGSSDPGYAKRFTAINEALQDIRDQLSILYRGQTEMRQPYFNCWFISMPQLLILLDDVTDAASFREALWQCRHLTTGTSDLYFEISHMRKIRTSVA